MTRAVRGKRYSRRAALAALAAVPAAAAAVAGSIAAQKAKEEEKPEPKPPKPSPYARFVSKDEEGLSGEERSRFLNQSTGLEGALKKIRDFALADDVEPAMIFRPRRSKVRS